MPLNSLIYLITSLFILWMKSKGFQLNFFVLEYYNSMSFIYSFDIFFNKPFSHYIFIDFSWIHTNSPFIPYKITSFNFMWSFKN